MSSFTIVSSALLRLSVADPAGTLTVLVSTSVSVRSRFAAMSFEIATLTLLEAWPATKASTLLIRPKCTPLVAVPSTVQNVTLAASTSEPARSTRTTCEPAVSFTV